MLETNGEIDNSELSLRNASLELVDMKVAVILSVIPMKLFNLSDEILHRTIKDKIEAKSY